MCNYCKRIYDLYGRQMIALGSDVQSKNHWTLQAALELKVLGKIQMEELLKLLIHTAKMLVEHLLELVLDMDLVDLQVHLLLALDMVLVVHGPNCRRRILSP